MTTTYDPRDPGYWDAGDLRQELTRVYDLCHGCRLCFKFCPAFPSLFEMIDRHDDQDAARLTPREQDHVVEQCFNCKLCYINCPYTPDQHEWAIDFPRLMLRAKSVGHRDAKRLAKARLTDQFLGRTDLVGKLGSATAPVLNRLIATPDSLPRRLMQRGFGIASKRVLAPYARQRFSTWFERRARLRFARRQGRVALFPTCLVEYSDTAIGKDLVRVYEHNGIECTLPEGQVCCGAPFLHAGDVKSFRRHAKRNIEVLVRAVRDGYDVVVPEPTCSYVLKHDYEDHVGGQDAEVVARSTFDASEYLMKVHRAEGRGLDLSFHGEVPQNITYHAPCHLRAQNIGLRSRDLLKLTGAKVTVVAECSGIDGTWGMRAENYEASRGVAKKMRAAIKDAGNEAVAGDCSLANVGIIQETGLRPMHPIRFMARAYGIPEE